MSENAEQFNPMDKLTPQRKLLVEEVIKNLEQGTGLWKRGWRVSGAPESASTGKKYRGVNNFYLTLISMAEGYSDNRWATFNQVEQNGWKFKTDAEGNSLAKGKSATVEFFELRDRETKKPFDKSVLDGMTPDEKQDYMNKNIYPYRKYYRVFNADLIDGIPAKTAEAIDESTRSERAESFIQFWSDTEAEIAYGGNEAFYSSKSDKIRLPIRDSFVTAEDFYSTALHEIGHSTGHETRLNRDLSGEFGSESYAEEELRAEIASMFIEQEFGVQVDESAVRNNAAYIQSWSEKIKEDPEALFRAISDADKIAKYITEKEKQKKKRVEKYAIVQSENAVGEMRYRVYMMREHGQTALAINYEFESIEELMKEFDNFQQAPAWRDAEFQEVSFDELEAESVRLAEEKEARETQSVKEEESQEYIRPSTLVAKGAASAVAVNMAERGVDSLQRLSDREVVEKAKNVKSGDTFTRLYNGEKVFESEAKDEKILMMRLGMFCNGDKEQLMRVFKSSGQFRDDKPNSYYSQLAEQTMKSIGKITSTPKPIAPTKGRGNFNTKT